MATLSDIVTFYLDLREQKKEIEERHRLELRPLQKNMALLEAAMQKLLDEQGTKSASVSGVGTCFKTKWTKTRVTDWEETLQWIVDNQRWELLTHAVSKTAVIDLMTQVNPETGETTLEPCPVPGVEVDSGYKVQVRRTG